MLMLRPDTFSATHTSAPKNQTALEVTNKLRKMSALQTGKLLVAALICSLRMLHAEAVTMPPDFSITVACTNNPGCIFTGNYLPITITVYNPMPYPIGFPRSYVQARGPAMILVDTETGRRKVLKVGLANHALMKQLTTLSPGATLTLTTVIHETELTYFRKQTVDLTVQISLSAGIGVPDQDETVRAGANSRLRIMDRAAFERNHAQKTGPVDLR